MATEVELPDGTILEIPDGADPSAVAKAYLAKRNQKPKPLSLGGGIARSAADLYQGAASFAGLPLDLLAGIYNYGQSKLSPGGYDVTRNGQRVRVSGQIPTMSQQVASDIASLGVPEAQTPFEQTTGSINRALGGAALSMGLGGAMAGAAGPIASGLGKTLASRPLTQLSAAAGSGASSDLTRQYGGGPLAQVLAGIGGGMAGGALGGLAERVSAATIRPQASAAANATANVSPGVAAAENTVSGGATAVAKGGGFNAGQVGPDDYATVTDPLKRVAERGDELGFRLTPGQATGSRALQQIEAKLESQPMTSGPFNRLKQQNQTALNRAVAESIGVKADVVDETTLSRALANMERRFEDAADEVPREIDPRRYLEFISTLQDRYRGLVKGLASETLIEDLTSHATRGSATGKQLQSLTSKLGAAAYKQMTTPSGDRDLGAALYDAKDYVDDLLMQGMTPGRAADFQLARSQYRNLMLLTRRAGTINPSSGNVAGRSLANVLQSRDRRGFLFGENRSPMYDAARFSQAYAPIVGDSGTATRSSVPSPTDFVLSLPFNLASRAYVSSPAVSLATAAQAAANSAPGQSMTSLTAGARTPQARAAILAALLAQRQQEAQGR